MGRKRKRIKKEKKKGGDLIEKKEKIEAFKNELRNLKYYEKEIKKIEEKIKEIEYEEENVKGILYSKQPSTPNPSIIAEKRLSLIEKKEELEKEKKEIETIIKRIKKILSRMQPHDYGLVKEVLIDKRNYLYVCVRRNISSTSVLYYQINKIIEKALEKKEV